MECPECHGKGQISLFLSRQECEGCAGTGICSEKSEKTEATDPPATLQNAYEGGATMVRLTEAPPVPLLTRVSGGSFKFQLQSIEPEDLEVPLGSTYICEDGGPSLWVKTTEGPDGWEQIVTGARGSATPDLVTEADAITLVAKYATVLTNKSRRQTALPILEIIPAIAPLSTAILADMMAVIEQEGAEVTMFVSSARDFADMRKLESGLLGVLWEGGHCSYFGVPVFSSHEVPAGYFAAVGAANQLVFATVVR